MLFDLVEFINTDLKSKKTTDTITNALAANMKEDGAVGEKKAADLTTKITESITVEANGIVRGAYISDRKLSSDSKNVSVTVVVDKRSMIAANSLKNTFSK